MKNADKAFSVVIPLFNKQHTITRAIESVLKQTVQPVEIIVVNDGSTDNGPAIVESLTDSRVRLIHQENQGVSAARNRGIQEAGQNLIAFLDADDEWLPDFLETIHYLVETYPRCAAYATRYLFGMPDGRTRPCKIRGLDEDFSGVLPDYFRIASKSDPPINSSTVVIKKTALDAVGGFPVGIRSGEDLLIWARIACMGDIAYSMKPDSIFWLVPGHVHMDKPTRVPDEADPVGRLLKKLVNDCEPENSKGLKTYIALWHKMRASIYLRLDQRRKCVREVALGLFFNPLLFKLYGYLVLAVLPEQIVNTMFQRWHN